MDSLPPALYNRDAEYKVIGSALLSAHVAERVAGLPDELFVTRFIREHVLPALRKLVGSGTPPTPDVVLNEIVDSAPQHCHGMVSDMVAAVESPELVDYYCDVLKDYAVLRRFRRLINRLERKEEGPPLATITREVERAASLLGTTGGGLRLLADAAENLEDAEKPPVLKTGIAPLDDYLQIRPGHLVFVAATPGVGKTSLAVQMSSLAAENGLKVLFISLEMSAEEIARRVAARRGITSPPSAIREYLRSLQIYYETVHTPGGVREQVRALKPDVVFVDYIGLMSADENRGASRVNELATISRNLKVIARSAECPVIVMSQLNRNAAPDDSGVARPQLHHLRDSGALEADADAVILLSNAKEEDPYTKRIALAKNRHGPVGTWEAQFDPVRCAFE